MNTKLFNLALMVMWLALCLGLLTREWWMPDAMRERVTGPNTPIVIGVAGLLALWNFMRFFIAYRFSAAPGPSKEVEEYRRRIRALSGQDPKVTDPQLNFDDAPPDAPPRNGHE
ncbi:MAG TPA: hypothetical protein VHR66_06040 [Gemmataceae bacterium]|jgi:hypothetical protein|nr:hypothetical protein [Gemmataceae bacterium]